MNPGVDLAHVGERQGGDVDAAHLSRTTISTNIEFSERDRTAPDDKAVAPQL